MIDLNTDEVTKTKGFYETLYRGIGGNGYRADRTTIIDGRDEPREGKSTDHLKYHLGGTYGYLTESAMEHSIDRRIDNRKKRTVKVQGVRGKNKLLSSGMNSCYLPDSTVFKKDEEDEEEECKNLGSETAKFKPVYGNGIVDFSYPMDFETFIKASEYFNGRIPENLPIRTRPEKNKENLEDYGFDDHRDCDYDYEDLHARAKQRKDLKRSNFDVNKGEVKIPVSNAIEIQRKPHVIKPIRVGMKKKTDSQPEDRATPPPKSESTFEDGNLYVDDFHDRFLRCLENNVSKEKKRGKNGPIFGSAPDTYNSNWYCQYKSANTKNNNGSVKDTLIYRRISYSSFKRKNRNNDPKRPPIKSWSSSSSYSSSCSYSSCFYFPSDRATLTSTTKNKRKEDAKGPPFTLPVLPVKPSRVISEEDEEDDPEENYDEDEDDDEEEDDESSSEYTSTSSPSSFLESLYHRDIYNRYTKNWTDSPERAKDYVYGNSSSVVMERTVDKDDRNNVDNLGYIKSFNKSRKNVFSMLSPRSFSDKKHSNTSSSSSSAVTPRKHKRQNTGTGNTDVLKKANSAGLASKSISHWKKK